MNLNLTLLPNTFAICRLDAKARIPDWVQGNFMSITRTNDELSVICRAGRVPDGIQSDTGWRCLQVTGKLDFAMVGVIASLTTVLATAGISVFVVSTFDTDFVLVKDVNLARAVQALEEAGHSVTGK